MSRRLDCSILYPWSDRFHDTMTQDEFCIFIHFSTRNTEKFRYLISLEQITYVHRYSTQIRVEYSIFFLIEITVECSPFCFEAHLSSDSLKKMLGIATTLYIDITRSIELRYVDITREDISYTELTVCMFEILSESDRWKTKYSDTIIFYRISWSEYYPYIGR